mmetsp:Transcript_96423/g.251324  ORF Transcript_96423/g.251324 Transcript_96423/m.251324 type:complete len:205 (+) Transcript_96423:628-1242(+)
MGVRARHREPLQPRGACPVSFHGGRPLHRPVRPAGQFGHPQSDLEDAVQRHRVEPDAADEFHGRERGLQPVHLRYAEPHAGHRSALGSRHGGAGRELQPLGPGVRLRQLRRHRAAVVHRRTALAGRIPHQAHAARVVLRLLVGRPLRAVWLGGHQREGVEGEKRPEAGRDGGPREASCGLPRGPQAEVPAAARDQQDKAARPRA